MSSCIPVRIVNRNLDSTYVYLKFSPEETHDAIKKGSIKGAIYIDDALLPPRYTKMEGKISRCIIIPHGKHKLMIDAEGYKTWQKELFFSGSWLKLKIELEQK
jgi:hypothetical protein